MGPRAKLASGVLLAVGLPFTAACAGDNGPLIYKAEAAGVIRIQAIGTKSDGSMSGEDGTGFVISSTGYVLTASHVIPEEATFSSLVIGGYLGPETGGSKPYQLELVGRSDRYDAALLKMRAPPSRLTSLALRKSPASVGEQLFVLGYPLGLADAHFLDGRVGAVADDALTTNALVDRGNSGGPVVDADGCVIGIVFGGITSKDGMPVNGLKFAVPITSLSDFISPDVLASREPGQISQQADVIHVSDALSRLQTDHDDIFKDTVKSYHDTIPARDGYVIEKVESIGHGSLAPTTLSYPNPVIAPDEKSMSFDYVLDSGPLVDQRRSWIDMTINTEQRLIGPVGTIPSRACP